MKLGKTSWLILILGILIIAFGSLGVTRAQQVEEQKQVEKDLTVAENRLTNLQLREMQNQKLSLEQDVAEAESRLKEAQDAIREPIASIGVTDVLFQIAEATDVTITQVTSSDIGKDTTLQKITTSVVKLNVRAEGEVFDLIAFVAKLNTDFTTGMVQSAVIGTLDLQAQESTEGTAGEEETEGAEGQGEETAQELLPTASIVLIIYSY